MNKIIQLSDALAKMNYHMSAIEVHLNKMRCIEKDLANKSMMVNPEQPIIELTGLDFRVKNCLTGAGIKKFSELSNFTDSQLLRIPNLGLKSMQLIRHICTASNIDRPK